MSTGSNGHWHQSQIRTLENQRVRHPPEPYEVALVRVPLSSYLYGVIPTDADCVVHNSNGGDRAYNNEYDQNDNRADASANVRWPLPIYKR